MFLKNIKKITFVSLVIIVTFGLTVSFQSLLAAWRAPSQVPVGGNVQAPVYSYSTTDQTITGGGDLDLANDFSADYAYFDSLGVSGAASIGTSIEAKEGRFIENVIIGYPSGYLQVNGSARANVFEYLSDKRLKKDIVVVPNALNRVLKLEGVKFKWKSNGKIDLGLIAQDVEKVFPELVGTDEKTGMKSVEYANLVAPMIEAIKEQQKQINELRAEIEELRKK